MNPWGVTASPPTEAAFFNAARATTFLLVEGATDERFWAARVDFRACQIRPTGSRDAALATLRTVRTEGKEVFVAVLDADFDRLDGTLPADADVVWTDLHDLETILLASPALDKVLVEVASRAKCRSLEVAEGRTVREALIARGLEMGRLRWVSRRGELSLTFRKAREDGSFNHVDHGKFCDRTTWTLDVAKLVKTVLDFSMDPRTLPADLLSCMKALPAADPWQLCTGHDLVGLLAVGLRHKLGSRKPLSIEDIEERLRLAFEQAHLERTGMFAALRRWELDHVPFRLFAS